jgi:hypothetical protein
LKIKARKKTKCVCGSWVVPGYSIEWDPVTKTTVGCISCMFQEEHPDPHAESDNDTLGWTDSQ